MNSKILKSAGKRGKTKAAIAGQIGINYSAVSAAVNALVTEGKLVVTGKSTTGAPGRPALVYGAAS